MFSMGSNLSESQICQMESNVEIEDLRGHYFGELEWIGNRLTASGVGIFKSDQSQIFIGNFQKDELIYGDDYIHLDLS